MPKKTERKADKGKKASTRRKSAPGPRAHLRRLVDELPERELATAARMLAYLRDTGDPFADVETVDEPLTAEEIADAEAGWQECLEGKGRPIEDVYRELVGDIPR